MKAIVNIFRSQGKILQAALALFVTPWLSLLADTESSGITYPVQESSLWLRVPYEIQHLIREEATATAIIRVGESGKVVDWVCLYLPHYKLLQPMGTALEEMSFKPATLNGEPVAIDLKVKIPVGEVGYYGILTLTAVNSMEAKVAGISHFYEFKACSPEELDAPLRILFKGRPVVAVDENGNRISGSVKVEFYVDSEGVPHLLWVDSQVDVVLQEAAYLTVEQFRFSPPRHNHRPTVVRASIRLDY